MEAIENETHAKHRGSAQEAPPGPGGLPSLKARKCDRISHYPGRPELENSTEAHIISRRWRLIFWLRSRSVRVGPNDQFHRSDYGFRNSSGSFAIFAAIRRASALVSDLSANRRLSSSSK
jgi:hypothetical protein